MGQVLSLRKCHPTFRSPDFTIKFLESTTDENFARQMNLIIVKDAAGQTKGFRQEYFLGQSPIVVSKHSDTIFHIYLPRDDVLCEKLLETIERFESSSPRAIVIEN